MRNTKIVHDVTLKHMKMNKKRTVISITGIALMVMLLTCVLVGKDTAYRYFVDLGIARSGAYHFAVCNIDREKLEIIKGYDEVKETGVTEDLKLTEFNKSANPSKPFLNIRRYSPEAMEWMGIKPIEGRLPENDTEIVISKSALDDGSAVSIGDTIDAETFTRYIRNNGENDSFIAFPLVSLPAGETVELPYNMCYIVPEEEGEDGFYKDNEEIHKPTGFAQKFTVVGFIERPVFEDDNCAWYSAISYVDETILTSGTFNILLTTYENRIQSDFYTRLYDLAGYENVDSNNGVLIFSGGSSQNSLNFIVRAMQIFFVVLIALISVMLIYNVFALSYDERARYLGMLSSVGATGKQKRSSVYFEAFVMLLPSFPLGFAAGLGVVKIASRFAGPMAQKLFSFDGSGVLDLEPVLEIKPVTVAAVILLSVVTVFISALIPARKISKVGPIESIRGNKKKKRSGHKADKNPDRLLTGSSEGMLASRFLKNDRSRAFGIIRAVAIFFLVTTVVYFGSSLLIHMVDYKLRDNGVRYEYLKDREYRITMIDSGDVYDFDDIIGMIKGSEGVTDVAVCKAEMWSLYISNDSLSDEYWDDYYEIVNLYYPAGTFSKEDFDEEYRHNYYDQSLLGVIAFEDEVFEKLAKEVKAEQYGEDDIPCIILNNVSMSTDEYSIYGQNARDFRYLEVKDAFVQDEGDMLPVYPCAISRAEAEERGYNLDEMEFPEIELDGPADFKVIKKVGIDDVSGYLNGTGEMALNIIVPMSTADYIDKINSEKLTTGVFFNCDNEQTLNNIGLTVERLENEGGYIHFDTTETNVAEYKEIIAYLIRIVLIVFTAIASAICLLNVYSSISALMVSRRKHFAVLKSMGSTFRQLIATELRESCGMLIRSMLIAIPVTGMICFLLSKLMIKRFGYFTIEFPWIQSLILIAFIIAAVILMTVICLRRENKIDIIEEIKRESV